MVQTFKIITKNFSQTTDKKTIFLKLQLLQNSPFDFMTTQSNRDNDEDRECQTKKFFKLAHLCSYNSSFNLVDCVLKNVQNVLADEFYIEESFFFLITKK